VGGTDYVPTDDVPEHLRAVVLMELLAKGWRVTAGWDRGEGNLLEIS
jgi:hypothetical protein